ncbi:MAG: hypothetical protein ABR947_05705 [Solirubrobacteraceae bacterium]|jgi:hypothetical protein
MNLAAAAGVRGVRRAARRTHARLTLAATLAAAACAAALLGSPPPAGASATETAIAATATAPNPAANIPLGPLPRACAGAPTGAACEDFAIERLDGARAKLGLGPYLLPRGFVALSPPRQWLVLANLDRIAYAQRPIRGLVLQLDAIAKQGALAREDPNPWGAVAGLPGQSQIAFASNWAGGQDNALLAYYGWMYDDGYGGPNLDCSSPSAAGCWGHRQGVLAFASGPALSMGAAAIVHGDPTYALTIVATTTAPWPYSYTWARAQADGAGR